MVGDAARSAAANHRPAPLPSAIPPRQADETLGQFLDYCTLGHMIDNVVLIVTGALHERDVSELLSKCHPLGMFDSIATLAVAQNMRELYRLVLVDTPLAGYFSEARAARWAGVAFVRGRLHAGAGGRRSTLRFLPLPVLCALPSQPLVPLRSRSHPFCPPPKPHPQAPSENPPKPPPQTPQNGTPPSPPPPAGAHARGPG